MSATTVRITFKSGKVVKFRAASWTVTRNQHTGALEAIRWTLRWYHRRTPGYFRLEDADSVVFSKW